MDYKFDFARLIAICVRKNVNLVLKQTILLHHYTIICTFVGINTTTISNQMTTDILRIIEGGLSNDKRKIITYSIRLAKRIQAEGDTQFAKCIMEQVQNYGSQKVTTADAMRMIPIDPDSKLQIVEIYPDDKTRTNIILSDAVGRQVYEFINIVKHADDLETAGLRMPKTMLLYGAPGCGKTSIAHYISEKTQLPLVVARLDGIVSSMLGSTAKNIRKIFSYATSMPCILFLDEFDAIAKARDDSHELGELKRVVNSLLQNIDNLPSSSVLIAATNHPELLDKAVWRRFITKIEISMPTDDDRMKIILDQIKGFEHDFKADNVRTKIINELMTNFSPSDIVAMFMKLKVKSIINNHKPIEYEDVLSAIFEFGGKNESTEDFIKYLSQNGVNQTSISKMLNVSRRQVKNVLTEK